jgi:Domain of unknown function (DUF1929)
MVLVAAVAGGTAVWSAPLPSSAVRAGPNPAVVGRWSKPFDIGTVAVHAAVLHSGKVLIWYWPHGGLGTDDGTGSVAEIVDPAGRKAKDASIPFAYDAFCGGNTILPDGRVFVAGGNDYANLAYDGNDQTALFDPGGALWSAGPSMRFARWYPSTTELPDGDVLIMSGWERDHQQTVHRIERYDADTGKMSRAPTSASLGSRLYPRTFLLPDGDIVRVGPEAETMRLDASSWTWSTIGSMLHGTRFAGTAVLLPGMRRILAIGGEQEGTAHATDTAEILEVGAGDPHWRSVPSMHHPRLYMNAVILPDGNVLVVGGGYVSPWEGPVRQAELFDTGSETWSDMAAQAASRMYHSTAVLLPDGRVMSAGQNNGDLQRTAEIFSPPYLFRGPRPTIASAPRRASYGDAISIATPDGAGIARVALVKAGSVTHSVNFDQRYVDLPFTTADQGLRSQIPGRASVAPPGWYMLFVVDGDGVPSIARWMHLGGA